MAPATKPVPVIVTDRVVPALPEDGDMDVAVGDAAAIVNVAGPIAPAGVPGVETYT